MLRKRWNLADSEGLVSSRYGAGRRVYSIAYFDFQHVLIAVVVLLLEVFSKTKQSDSQWFT